MFLVELVLQGVRGFHESERLRFKSGFNLVIAGNESGKTTAVNTIQRLLFPVNQAPAIDLLVSRHTPDTSRAALVVSSSDNAYYRIIQDFSKRAVNISRYNPQSKDFTLLHKDWDNAGQFMAGVTAGMTEEDFSRIFVFQRERHAARSGTIASAAVPGPARTTPVPHAGGKSSGNQEKLAELREAMRKAEEAADAEYKYQAVKLALEDTRKKITSLEEVGRKKAEMESTLESLKAYRELPDDLAALIEAHERRLGQKLSDVDELNKQIEGVKNQRVALPPVDLISDKLFITGGALGVLSVIVGGFVLTGDKAYYILAGGILLSLTFMAVAWYNGTRKDAQRTNYLKEEEHLKHELAEIEKRFQQEGAAITACMRSTGASSLVELKEKAENYRYFLSLGADLEEQRHRILGDLTPEILQQQRERQQQEIVELEKAAQALAQYNVDTYAFRQDIERLETESSASGGASWDFGAEAQELPTDFADVPAGGDHGGFLEDLGIASRVGGIGMETLVPAVEAAAQWNLAAVTAGRYVKLEVGHEGDPIVHAKDNSVVAYSELSHGTRSLITFCLRTGLIEALVGKKRLTFLLDDSLADLDPARQKTACQILRALGAKIQVILFTSNPALRAEGDAALELK